MAMPKPTSVCRATERKHPWPMVRLGDVCEMISSRGHQIKQSEILPEGKYPVVSQSENEIEGFSNKEICIADVPVILFGDHTCNVKLVNKPFVVGADGTKLLKPNRHCMQYLYYCLQLLVLKLQDGKYRRHFGDLCDSEIPLPPLSVQREIVARLERELAAVEKMKKGFEELAETAKAEFKAELKEVFEEISRRGAETRRLGDVCEVLDSKRVPITKKDRILGDIPYYGATGVVDYVSDFIFDERLVLLGEDGAKWGAGDNSAFIIDGKSWVNNHVHVLRPMSLLADSFLVWYLNYADLSEYITGVTVPKLNQQRMGQIEIPLPPLAVQREVVARLDVAKAKAEKLEAKAREGVAVCETMRKAILKEAFE